MKELEYYNNNNYTDYDNNQINKQIVISVGCVGFIHKFI